MNAREPDVKAIFAAALERSSGPERDLYLASACGGDDDLRARVEELLAAHSRASAVPETPEPVAADTAAEVPSMADQRSERMEEPRTPTPADSEATEQYEPAVVPTLADPDATSARTAASASASGVAETVTIQPGRTDADHDSTSDFMQTAAADRDRMKRGTLVRYFGDYEVREELGRGGMGVVYHARQITLNRPVALKMIKVGVLANDTDLRRFQNEAEAVALLDHPGIVPVYEIGEHDGQRFFSMKLIQGGNLAERLGTMKGNPRAAANLVAEAAEAIHHAHMRGILHRDLKPANILVDAEGRPHVTDFGLAKRVEEDVEFTASGAILGTPAYMSPEQAAGRRGSITTATDVYGLGAILYALLAGKAPFGGDSVVETIDAVRNTPPEPPSRHNASVPRDLETIALTCLDKDPRRRYSSAQALADDLRRWLDNRPIAARRVGAAERVWLWCKRRPAVAALSAMVILVSLAGIAFGGWQWRVAVLNAARAERNAGVAQANADLANRRNQELTATNLRLIESREELRRNLYTAEIKLAANDWNERVIPRMKALLARQVPKPGQRDLRGFEWHYLHRLCHAERRVLEPGIGALTALAVSPDGRWMAVGGRNGDLAILAAESGEVVRRLPSHPYEVNGLAFRADGRRLASCAGRVLPTEEGEVKVWDVETGRPLPAPEALQGIVNTIAYSPDGTLLATGSSEELGTVQLWDANSGTLIRRLELPTRSTPFLGVIPIGNPVDAAFSPDGSRLAVSIFSRPGGLLEFDVATGKVLRWAEAHLNPASGVAYGPAGRVALGSSASIFTVWDSEGDQPALTIRPESSGFTFAALRPDGHRMASAGNDRVVRIWDAADGRLLATLGGHDDVIAALAFTPDGQTLASASWDGTVRLWDPDATPESVTLAGNADGGIDTLNFRDDGALLVASSFPPTDQEPEKGFRCIATVWDLDAGRRRFTVSRETRSIWFPAAFRPKSGDLVVAGGWNRVYPITLYDTRTGALLRETLPNDITGIRHLVASPDGRYLVSDVGHSADLLLWDATTFRLVRRLQGHTRQINALAFDATGKRIASASSDNSVRLWDVDSGREVRTLSAGDQFVPVALAFHPDGRRLAVGDGWYSGTVLIWDVESGQKLSELRGHSSDLGSVAYSPDGRRLATAAGDGQIKIWDADSGDELLTLSAEGARSFDVLAFHPSGQYLVSGGNDGLVRLWDSAPITAPSFRLAEGGDLDPFDRIFPADPFARGR